MTRKMAKKMAKKNSKKPEAIALLKTESNVAEIAKRTGLSVGRVYQIREELRNKTPREAEAEEKDTGLDWVKEQLQEAMSTILDDIKNGRTTNAQSVESILAVADTLVQIYDRENPDPHGIGMGADGDGRQIVRGAIATRSSFVERLAGRPDGTGSDD